MNPHRPMKSSEPWKALGLCFLASVVIFIPYTAYSTQLPRIMSDLAMTYVMAAALASSAAFASGVILPFAGVLVDRWGARNVSVLGLVVAAVGQVGFACAPSYSTILAARVVEGIGVPLLFLGPYTLATRWAEIPNRLGVFLGTMLATDGIGNLVALYGYSGVMNALGWRNGSLLGAGITFGAAVLLSIFLHEPPHFAQLPGGADASPLIRGVRDYLSVIGQRNVLITAAFLVGIWGTSAIAVYWVPTILMEHGWKEATAGFMGALYPLAGTVFSVGFGVMSDRLGRRKPLMLISGIGMTAAFLAAAAAISAQRYELLAATLPIAGLFGYGGLPLGYCLAADAAGVRRAATANGFIMGAGSLLGGVLYPFALGYVRDATGLYTVGFLAAAISLVFLNVLSVLAARESKAPPITSNPCTTP